MEFQVSTDTGYLGLSGVSQALKATILADTNRDGKVDIKGNTDNAGKDSWNEGYGALFLANIGDTDRRCSSKITTFEYDDTDTDYSLCNDATDNVQRNPKYLASVLTVPNPDLSDSATGSVVIVDQTAASKVRLFHKDGADWTYIPSNYTFTAQNLKKGLTLGVDARDTRTTEWDGRATLQFSVKDGGVEAKDSVAMRVAPVLTHHHGQLAEQVFATAWSEPEMDGVLTVADKFVQDLTEISARAGVKKPLFPVNTTDEWTQDFFEPGYTSIPGQDGPVVLRIMIASAQNSTSRIRSRRWLFRELRSDSVGAIQHRTYGDTTDSTGNLETVPPYAYNGKSYPVGRAIMGSHHGVKPQMVKFLDAQEVQAPIEIDTTWLEIGHTDEFMQFLPTKSQRGWVMMVDDPLAGLKILQEAQKAGHGKVQALSRTKFPHDDQYHCLPTDTIDDVLNRANFTGIQEYCDKNIKANIDILKRETGITDEEILRVPTLYHPAKNTLKCIYPWNETTTWNGTAAAWKEGKDEKDTQDQRKDKQGQRASCLEAAGPGDKSSIARREASDVLQVSALYPGTINGVVLSDSQYVAPNPWGPIIDGKDVLATAVSAVYAKVNYNVNYIDDWFSHHTGQGEVHCGSNTVREVTATWW